MGDYGGASSPERKEVHMLVTGFGPFRKNVTNPSFLIAQSLPATLPPRSASDPIIHIHALPAPIRVAYKFVRQSVPALLFTPRPSQDQKDTPPPGDEQKHPSNSDSDSDVDDPPQRKPNYDAVLFLGLANEISYYRLEQQAHRDVYKLKDVDGETMKDDRFWKDAGAPSALSTGFDVKHVFELWRDNVSDMDGGVELRPSLDPGRFLCDFIYYTGLFEYWKGGNGGKEGKGGRPVLFLHVPGSAEEKDVETGTEVTKGLIRAMERSLVERGAGWVGEKGMMEVEDEVEDEEEWKGGVE